MKFAIIRELHSKEKYEIEFLNSFPVLELAEHEARRLATDICDPDITFHVVKLLTEFIAHSTVSVVRRDID